MGVKTKFTPFNSVLGGTFVNQGGNVGLSQSLVTSIDHWSDPDTLATTGAVINNDQIIQQSFFKTYNPTKGFSFYRSNKPIAKIQNIDWADSA